MRRPRTAFGLIITLLAALLAPVQAGWACPDGRPCAAMRSHPSGCVMHSAGATCCAHSQDESRRPALTTGGGCHFSAPAPAPAPFWEPPARSPQPAADLVPAPVPALIALPGADRIPRPDGETALRPPPLLTAGPSRAPPLA